VRAGVKKYLVPFLVVDLLFFAAIAFWLIYPRMRPPAGKAVMRVELRHPENKLTEIDLVNDGNAAGAVTASVDVSWPDADLVDAKGLSQYTETDTGRRSLRFYPDPSLHAGTPLSPGEPCVIGWVKLTDDVPVHAEIVTDSSSTTEP
jgi:hypothetical protein